MNTKYPRTSTVRAKWLALAATLFTLPAMAATYVVNATSDSVDATPGDGVCSDSAGLCTLRAAVMEANAHAGADTIDLTGINNPSDPIVLTLAGPDETFAPVVGGGGGFAAVATHDASKGDLNLTDSVTITGAGSALTIVEWAAADQAAGAADRIFHIEAVTTNVTVAISGLTIRNGLTSPVYDIQTNPDGKIWQFKRHGGGIAVGASAATNLLDPSIVHGSGGGMGGGGGHGGSEGESAVAVDGVTLTDVNVLNCLSGADGGGIFNTGPMVLSSSVVSGNIAASNGGGVYTSAALTVIRTTIGTMASNAAFSMPNKAENGGGMFDTGLHTTLITESAIVGNYATGGGALAGRSTTIDNIENSTISGNVARDAAGGITTNGRVNLRNVTIADNQVVPTSTTESSVAGVGLNSFASGQFTYVNTLLSNNVLVGATNVLSNCGRTGGGASGSFLTSTGHNLENGDTCNLTAAGDLRNTAAQLQPLANNGGLTETRALPPTSAAVDAGDNTVCPNGDQRGSVRPADGNLDGRFVCDIGAYELFVHTADLHIDSMTAPDHSFATDSLTITIGVHSDPSATTSASDVVISTSALPASFTIASALVTTPGGDVACSVLAGVVSCPVGSLAPGDVATAQITGTPSAPGAIAVTGTVSSSAPIDPNLANNSATVNIAVIGNADMGVTGSGSTTPVNAAANTDITFTVTNNGPDAANNARVAAFLPAGLTYQGIVVSAGTCTYSSADSSVTCALGTLASGASVTGTLTATAAKVDGTFSVLFGAAANERDAQPNNDTAEVSLRVLGLSDLKLALALDAPTITVGQIMPVHVTVTNLGAADTMNVVVVVTLPAGTTFASTGTGSSCSGIGSTVTCNVGTLLATAASTSTFSVRTTSGGTMSFNATVSSDLVDPDLTNNSASTTFTASFPHHGGCSYQPGGEFDPTLPLLLAIGMLGMIARRPREAAPTRK